MEIPLTSMNKVHLYRKMVQDGLKHYLKCRLFVF